MHMAWMQKSHNIGEVAGIRIRQCQHLLELLMISSLPRVKPPMELAGSAVDGENRFHFCEQLQAIFPTAASALPI